MTMLSTVASLVCSPISPTKILHKEIRNSRSFPDPNSAIFKRRNAVAFDQSTSTVNLQELKESGLCPHPLAEAL